MTTEDPPTTRLLVTTTPADPSATIASWMQIADAHRDAQRISNQHALDRLVVELPDNLRSFSEYVSAAECARAYDAYAGRHFRKLSRWQRVIAWLRRR